MLILKISLFWEVLEVVWQKVRLLKKDVKSSEAEKLFYFILSWMQM